MAEMAAVMILCPRCHHDADLHSGSLGCIGCDEPGDDCFCTVTHTAIILAATAAARQSPSQRSKA